MKNRDAKTTEADMQNLFAYMDKLGVNYTINRNPSPEEIERIQKSIASREAYMKSVQDAFKK